MRPIATSVALCLSLAALPAWAAHLVYAPTVGGSGGYVVENSNHSASVVFPGVAGGTTILNNDNSMSIIVPNPLNSFAAASGAGQSAGLGGVLVGTGSGGGIIVNGQGFRTVAPGGTFCLPPCAATADGVAPDGTVVTSVP